VAAEDEKRVNDLRALIARLSGILDEASTLRQRLEQSIAGSRPSVERIGERKRRMVKGRRTTPKKPGPS